MAHSKLLHVVFLFCVYSTVHSGFTTTKIGPKPLWNFTDTDRLRQDLLLNYDKFARPTQHNNKTTVRFGVVVRHVEVNEFKSTVTVHCYIRMIWEDEKLRWNVDNYNGIDVLRLAEHEIWQPDIVLYNSATGGALSHYSNSQYMVYSGGDVLWVPAVQFTFLCNLNMKYWPFDSQECYMNFGSWTYHGDQIDMILYNNQTEVELDLLIKNSEWKIIKAVQERTEEKYSCCKEKYPQMMVNITLSRVSPSYKAVIITPTFVIIILTLLNFWLPPQAGEKILINGTTAIVICLYMLYFTQKIPAMGSQPPLIVLFYSSCMYIVSFSMIGSVAVISLSRIKHSNSLPWIIKQPLIGRMGKILGLHTYIQQSTMTSHRVTAEEMRDHQVTDFDDINSGDENQIIRSSMSLGKPSFQQDWILLAAAIDRISFTFYCLLFAILAIAYSV